MFTWIEEDDGYIIVENNGEYFCYTDTQDKANRLLGLLNI